MNGICSFEHWMASHLLQLDQSRARVCRVFELLASGLSTAKIREIIKKGDQVLRTEEEAILDAVDDLVR